jgi:ribonuclease D
MLGFILHLIKIMPISDGMFQSVVDPLTIGLAIGGVKALAGGIQALTAGPKQAEPKYEIPKEVFQATDIARQMAQTGMPEASRMMAMQAAQQAALFRQRAAGQSRTGQANVASSESLLSRDLINIAAQDASMRQQNLRFSQQPLMTQAQY